MANPTTAQDSLLVTSATFDELNSQFQSTALKATRNSMLLPSDINFHRTMDAEFSKDLDVFSSRVLSVANKLLNLASTADPSAKGKGKGKLESEDDVVDNFHSVVVDLMDQMMEKTDMSLDEFLGRNKAPAIAINMNATMAKKTKAKGALDPVIQHASHLPKPQLKFKRKIENNDAPWYPTLSHKYNAQVPLGYNYHDSDTDMEADDLIKHHPYRYEIAHISYPSRMFESTPPIPPTPFESTTFKWVNTISELESMLDELRKATEIAVDLEHHSYRTYAGFLCLMQISTRQQDWIVDLLVLREELAVLNEVFTDPKITKVLHGAESDIVWLQQDLELYIVNLFDTFHASKALGFPRHGLAHLLEMYCDFTPDKRYQLADWRIRPLPEEMLDYARSDTHFLLYIFDNLRNALLDRAQSQSSMAVDDINDSASTSNSYPPAQSLVREVLAKSEETSLRVYEKEYYDVDGGTGGNGWDTLAKKWNKINLYATSTTTGIPAMQRDIYRTIHSWRDRVAREEDESTRYVLPNHYIFQLAEQPPADMAAMLRIFNFVPPVLRRRAKELLDVIREAVRKHLSSEQEKPPPDVPAADSIEETIDVQQESLPSPLSKYRSIKPLENQSTISAPQSALFGRTMPLAHSQNSFASPLDRFAEVVARIHSTLVIAPSSLKASVQHAADTTQASSVEQSTTMDTEENILSSSAQVEMPFVPASQRAVKSRAGSTVDDAIVMVGQTRRKKRKRTKDAKSGDGTPKTENEDEETAPFDFDSAPNILDDAPAAEQSAIPRKKAKQAKAGGRGFYGDFPAPPKAHSELKSGNKSHTFK
ncbi:hypothetical protein BT96DRAFT_954400 [Gymnopus androsaceus JB14]|uniref:HRDC domain-containing protein n=1 Tax=Gymnopus androsaceus JB14 TaxID=1447944 RepID=A0A6A4IAY6_9AGAR|nr:hypothetical protein BT96DRAFT_954400 [Gymnopus androsaceus JB14]